METIDKIKKDAEKKNISIPLVQDDYVLTSGSELYGTIALQQTENAEETFSSVEALYYVLKEQYGEEFANRVLKRVYDRAQPFASKNATVDLIANANKKATSVYGNMELLTMLNRKRKTLGFVPPDKVPLTKYKINTNQNKYKGTKCCYVPKMCMSSLAGRERKYIAIDLRPATAQELKDFLTELESVNQESIGKISEEEFNLKQEQIAMLGLLLAKYHELKNERDGGTTELKIYQTLASLLYTEVLPKPKRIIVGRPSEDDDYEPATRAKDIDAIKEIEDHSNKLLRVFFEKGQNPTIIPNFAGNYVDILNHSGFAEEEITNERQ